MAIGIIYKIRNEKNGKQYIGQSWSSLDERWCEHARKLQRDKISILKFAIKKYGVESFTKEVICECKTQEELDKLEDDFILKFNTLSPNGYNIKRGGNGGKFSEDGKRRISRGMRTRTTEQHEAWRKKISVALKGRTSSKRGITLSSEHRRKLAISSSGKEVSATTRKKMSESHIGKIPWNAGKKMPEGFAEAQSARMIGKKRGPYKKVFSEIK